MLQIRSLGDLEVSPGDFIFIMKWIVLMNIFWSSGAKPGLFILLE